MYKIYVSIIISMLCVYCNDHIDRDKDDALHNCGSDVECSGNAHRICKKTDYGSMVVMCVGNDGKGDGKYVEKGDIGAEGYFKKGKRDGPWKMYYKGKLMEEGSYKSGIRHGVWKTFCSGIETSEIRYVDGKKEGKTEVKACNGVKIESGEYRKGMPNGYWEFWLPNSKKSKRGYYKHGKMDGRWEEWWPVGEWTDENVMEGYKCDKNRKCDKYVGDYKNGLKDGEWTEYDDREKEIAKRLYKNGNVIKKWSVGFEKDR